MVFHTEEALFSPTTDCNLNCPHCLIKKVKSILPRKPALRFLVQCKKLGVKRAGFTGGEPFLAPDFLFSLIRSAVKNGIIFDRIMTNGVWFSGKKSLTAMLYKLYDAGYDGGISVSVDAFHGQDLRKAALFIKEASRIWARPDIISVICVSGAREKATKDMVRSLARYLEARLIGYGTAHARIKSNKLFIRIHRIGLSPIGRAAALKDPWDGKWFKEDRCKGPGNIFFVLPNGDVKPCCGYATDSKELTIGNIKKDSASVIMKNARKNRYVRAVFGPGLSDIRRRLEAVGVKFPGKTLNHCCFCHYILNHIPKPILKACLD